MAEVSIRATSILLEDPDDIQLIPTPFGFFESYDSDSYDQCMFPPLRDNNSSFTIEEYADQIFNSMNVMEAKIERKRGRISEYRTAVIEWMTWVCTDFRLSDETLAYAVLAYDDYSSKTDIPHDCIQLIAAVCLWIASKMEERYIPALDDFVVICDNRYSKSMFTDAELDVVQLTQFDINKPTAVDFLDIFSSQIPVDEDLGNTAKFFCNAAYSWRDFSLHRPSHIALSCLILSKLFIASKTNLLVLSRILHDLDIEELCICCKEIFNIHSKGHSISICERHQAYDLINRDLDLIKQKLCGLPGTINDILDIQ